MRGARCSVLALAASVVSACGLTGEDPVPPVRVSAGIFFGGQLQERTKWPLLIDPARQSQGFRIRFRTPLTQPGRLSWELARPKIDHRKRVATSKSDFEATLPAGTSQNDQLVVFDETDRPGKWRLDVTFDGKSVYGTTIDVVPYAPLANDD